MRKMRIVRGVSWEKAPTGVTHLFVALLWAVALLSTPAPADVAFRDCTDPETACSLAETAAQAGFWAGAAVNNLASDPSTQATVGSHFNSITAENAMKWGPLAARVGEYDFSRADALVELAEERGARVRGHTLLWGRGPLPSDLSSQIEEAADPQARLREIIEEHIATVVGRYAGRVHSWDVVNEPLAVRRDSLDQNLFYRTLGAEYIADAFRAAHVADPGARLFLNEFFFVHTGSRKSRAFLALVEDLVAQGVPIHGVGVQAHFWGFFSIRLPTREEFQRFLQDLADLGVDVELTELDISRQNFEPDPDPLARQADFYADLGSACAAVAACRGITTWGIEDGDTWLDVTSPFDALAPHQPLLFDNDLQPKRAYFALRDAIAERIPPFAARSLLALFDESVADGSIEGSGPSGSDAKRLRFLRSSLERVVDLVEAKRFSRACRELVRVQRRLDPTQSPPDLATGPGVADLLEAITQLRSFLACDG